MSSRLIVKNLPRKITKKQLEEHFSGLGNVTDVKLALTRSGTFRRFAFVGYSSEEDAQKAVRYFDKTFINSSRIEVALARPIGDEQLPRPWSKYSKGSSAFRAWEKNRQTRHNDPKETTTREARERRRDKEKQQRLNQDIHKSKLAQLLGEFYELESNPDFVEFLEAHRSRSKAQTWSNDTMAMRPPMASPSKMAEAGKAEKKVRVRHSLTNVESKRPGGKGILLTRTHLKFDDNENDEEEVFSEEKDEVMDCIKAEEDVVHREGLSDMDYLRLKMVPDGRGEECDDQGQEDGNQCTDQDEEGETEGRDSDVAEEKEGNEPSSEDCVNEPSLTVKMRGLPFEADKEDIHTFFYPLKVEAIRMLYDPHERPLGYAFVDFTSESDVREALRRHRDCMGNRYVELFRDEGRKKEMSMDRKRTALKPWEAKATRETDNAEPVSESGRLFLRNLPYTITEDDLTKKFEPFGPLTEVTLPVDRDTNRPIGLAFLSYMLPEHAVTAYQKLDGTIFQGRLLHILPAKEKKTDTEELEEKSSYKKKKERNAKKDAGRGHNWNVLFLGANAVADAMADRYQTEKSNVLDTETSQSLAVRMALGETQLVMETREFLEENGVQLEVFEQQSVQRSKTVILVKNLPYGTLATELHQLFVPFGSLGRVILPPGGVSALVEFLEPGGARAAFVKLAYSKFKHLPLYLEWAPVGVIGPRPPTASGRKDDVTMSLVGGDESSSSCTVFVKNLNFETDDASLREHFSKVGAVERASVARRVSAKDPDKLLSHGYGFVQFTSGQLAARAVQELHHSELDGHQLKLEMARGDLPSRVNEPESAKIIVRNVPFEASKKEVRQLFATFGALKVVRLPRKMAGHGEHHRGFGFVEYATREDACRAFESLGRSTHLYGRRLVLEWAKERESVDDVRRRTAKHFRDDNTCLDQEGHTMSNKRRRGMQLLAALKKSE